MASSFRNHPSLYERQAIRRERARIRTALRLSTSPKKFDDRALALLREDSPLRPERLLALSDTLYLEAGTLAESAERVNTAAFESAYLSMAAVVSPVSVPDEAHPAPQVVRQAVELLQLAWDDQLVAEMLSALYAFTNDDWDTLDVVGTMEWCARVRYAVNVLRMKIAARRNGTFDVKRSDS